MSTQSPTSSPGNASKPDQNPVETTLEEAWTPDYGPTKEYGDLKDEAEVYDEKVPLKEPDGTSQRPPSGSGLVPHDRLWPKTRQRGTGWVP